MAEKHKTFDEFKAVLVENGAEFTVSVNSDTFFFNFGVFLVVFLNHCSLFQDTLIANLLRLIQTMRPSPSTRKGADTIDEINSASHVFCINKNSCFYRAADQTEVKPKSVKDQLKVKYPALCQPDALAWMVRLVKIVN